MPLELGRYGSRDIMDLSALKFNKGKLDGGLVWFMDYANSAEESFDGEISYASGGKGAPRRISFTSSRTGTVTISTQIYSLQQLASLAGTQVISETKNIFERELVTVTDNAGTLEVTLSKNPVDLNGDGSVTGADVMVYKYVNGVEDTATPVTVSTVTTNKLTVTGVADGDEVAVYYQWTTTNSAHSFSITAEDFPEYMTLVGDVLQADEVSGTMVDAQKIYYKARLQPSFSTSFSNTGDPAELSFVFDLFPVKINGKDTLAETIFYED